MNKIRDIMLDNMAESVDQCKTLDISDEEKSVFNIIADIQNDIEETIVQIKQDIPSSRERSFVITKLQEASLWLDEAPLS